MDGQWPDGLLASDNTLHFVHPLTFNYSGVYVCKVTNSLGQRSDQKVIYISGKLLSTCKMSYLNYSYNDRHNSIMIMVVIYTCKDTDSSMWGVPNNLKEI